MSSLNYTDRVKLEKLFNMSTGYVLDFTNSTLNAYFYETFNISIYSEDYDGYGDSKANRVRAFWARESNTRVAKTIKDFLSIWLDSNRHKISHPSGPLYASYAQCLKIAEELEKRKEIESLDSLRIGLGSNEIESILRDIEGIFNKGQAGRALDRLHSLTIMRIKYYCDLHAIPYLKDDTVNALYGKYKRWLNDNDLIKSEMSKTILKVSMGILEMFNDIRNNHSPAHPNPVLNEEESILIFNNIINLLKFIDAIEKKYKEQEEAKFSEEYEDDDVPF
jgi:hypothetical protein